MPANAEVSTALGSIPASPDTVKSEREADETVLNKVHKKFKIQISEVEDQLFTSSVNICPEACCKKGWGQAE
jgi:hypothetical protein